MENKKTMDKKPEKKKVRQRHGYKYDHVITKIRQAKIPLNRSSLKEIAVNYFIDDFTKENGEIDYPEMAKYIMADKIEEKVKNL